MTYEVIFLRKETATLPFHYIERESVAPPAPGRPMDRREKK